MRALAAIAGTAAIVAALLPAPAPDAGAPERPAAPAPRELVLVEAHGDAAGPR